MKRLLKNAVYVLLLSSFTLIGCSSDDKREETSFVSTQNAQLIREETISPNTDYVTSQKDIVKYSVQIYQNKDNEIIVNATSNSGFFDDMQYVLESDKPISEQDVTIEWTNLMGNPKPTEDDQLAIAHISISKDGKVVSERNINFLKKGMEIVLDALNS